MAPLASQSTGSSRSSRPRKRKVEEESASQSASSSKTSKSKRTNTYDPAFEQHLVDNGVCPEGYSEEEEEEAQPQNSKDIFERLKEPRRSLSPSRFSHSDHTAFKKRNRVARGEMDVIRNVFPTILGESNVPSSGHIEFSNMAPLTDGSIVNCKPDYYEGCRPADLNRATRQDLDNFIIPSTDTSRPCLPNFFTELKGPGGTAAVAKLQACYDGAIGARAMHHLRSYVHKETVFDNNAYTIASTYSGGSGGGVLTLYATHPIAPQDPDRSIDYRMTQLRGWLLTDNRETFREGVTAFRNARDWALDQRNMLIEKVGSMKTAISRADESASGQSTEIAASQSTVGLSQGSDTSVDELAADTGQSFRSSFQKQTQK